MSRKLATLGVLILIACAQRPHAQPGTARIFFVDIGQGAGTLIVSPAGKTLLVDGGPPGGGAKIGALLDTLGIATIDYTVLTHYHIDHDSGLIELLNAGRVAGIAYDNGDAPDVQPPGTSTSPTSTRGTYLNYVTATGHAGVTRQTIVPGQVIDLGGGMRATCLAAGGHLLSGGSVAITNDDLNTESVSLLVEYNDFDYVVSGDLTGGGSTSTAKTPDVETFAGQLAGDVDVIQLNHHGSTTTSNQVYLSTVKAEVAVAQIGTTNTFGHPNRETVNKYLNTPVTSGNAFAGTGVPAAGAGPVFYQPEDSPTTDDRVTHQGYSGASAAAAGSGTIKLETDGSTAYTLMSFDDGGVRLNPASHSYPVDSISPGVTTDFPPTVIAQTAPVAPLATDDVVVSALVNDRESAVSGVVLGYAINGVVQPFVPMTLVGSVYQGTIPAQANGTRVDVAVAGTANGVTTTFMLGYFSGVTPVSTLHALNALGEPAFSGYAARIQGAVTAGSNTFSAGTNDDYVQDATGGINVFRSTDTATPFSSTTPGQSVEVVGRVGFNGGRFRLDITESLEKTTSPYGISGLGSGPAPVPAPVTIAALNANPESYEGQLVSIANSQILSGTLPVTPQALDQFVTISDGTGSFSLKVDHDTDIEGFTPSTTFTVVGIIQQDDFLRPFNSGYDIAPRGRPDLGGTAAGATLISIASARVDAVNNADGTPGADFVPDLVNQLVKIRGAVTSVDFRGGNGIEYYVQDATGGIDLFSTSQNSGPFAVGDSVEAVGLVTHFNGLTEITVSSVSPLPPGTVTAATPQLVTLSQLAAGGPGEALEGRLIRVDDVTITSGTFPAAGADANLTITDATGSVTLRIDRDTNIAGTPTPGGSLSIIGLLGQFDTSAPFDSGYQLFPRALADITVSGASAITATPSAWDFASVSVGGSALKSFTITNTSGSAVTLTTPFTIGGANADQFTVGLPGTTTLAPSGSTSVSVTFQPTTAGAKAATLTIASSGGSAVVALTGTGQAAAGAGTAIVISEFRTRGPNGGNDEFIEVYNNTDAAIDIGSWRINGSNSGGTASTRATITPGTILPARRHYLLVNSAAGGYSGGVAGNQNYTTGITDDGGIAILKPAPDATIIDQVGFTVGSAYKEGTPIAVQLTTNTNRSYQRKPGGLNGSGVDTNDNSNDFQLITPSDPENLNSAPTPSISVSPTSVGFGSVVVGGTLPVDVTITNLSSTSSVTLTTPFTLGGTNPASFSIGLPGATTLDPSGSTTATVVFQPSSGGAHSATLTIATASNGSVTISLSGTATGGISVDQSTIDFGTQPVGSLAGATLTISAASTVTLSPPFAISGANPSEFFVGAPSTTSIGPGNNATVAVGFQPTSVGPKSASLLVTSVDGGSRTVSLTGNVACPTIAVSGGLPGGIVGLAYSQSLAASGGTEPYAFIVSAGALPAGLMISATGTVSGTPTAPGSFNATIRATDANGCSGEASFAIGVVAATLTAPASLSLGVVSAGAPAISNITVTNGSGFAITLLPPFAVSGSAQFTAGSPVAAALPPGASTTVPITFTPTAAGAATGAVSITSTNGGLVSVSLSGTGRLSSAAGQPIVISELRFRGAGGSGGAGAASDEFVELYNRSDEPVSIAGFLLRGSNSGGTVTTRATVAPGITIPAKGHFLFTNTVAQPALLALADQTFATGFTDDGGAAIAMPDGTIVDQVGLSAGSAYGEGTPLASLTTNTNQSYERRLGGANGSDVDTNDNAADFQLVTPSAPQNLTSVITPALTVSPATIDFGSIVRGTTASVDVSTANNASTPVTLTTPFALTGANVGDFSAAPPASATVAAGATTTTPVTFQPATTGSKSATLTIASTNGETHQITLSGASVCPAIVVSTSLPNIEAGVFYSQTLSASGGTGPYTFTLAGGALPGGFSLSSSGVVSGTTSAIGPYTFSVTATEGEGGEGGGCNGTATFTLTVADTIAPAITCAVADDVWHANNASLACTASDGGTGLANAADASFALTTAIAAGGETANAMTDSRAVCDLAGNCATAGPIGGNKIDRKGPVISLTTPVNGAVYKLNESVLAAYSCVDGGAGVGACTGTVAAGSAINTATLGSKTFVVNASDAAGNPSSQTVSYTVRRSLTAVGPAALWIGLKNSDDVGLRVDLRADLMVNGAVVAAGDLNDVDTGSSGFDNAMLQSLALSLSSSPVDVPANAKLTLRLSARRTCYGDGHSSGTVRTWFNGQPIDGGAAPDAGSRIRVTIGGVETDYFLRQPFMLLPTAGSARAAVDALVTSTSSCPSRPFTVFSTWSASVP